MSTAINISLPQRGRGRLSNATKDKYDENLREFCNAILQIDSSLDFKVSSRGWCYILEEYGLLKGDFDKAQGLLVECRKQGWLPLDIVTEDGARSFDNLEDIDNTTPEQEATDIIDDLQWRHLYYTPTSFWDGQKFYVEMLVEKIDLKSLFSKVCAEFHVPIANARGWPDLNSRAAMMRRFAEHEKAGRECVLLYCGDHDPGGLAILDFLQSNLEELEAAVGWDPRFLIIDRFGLNHDFIQEQNLTWIDNLVTGSGKRLDDPRHRDHRKPYVQDYLRQYGARKVEANALVVRVDAGRRLCREAITKYVDPGAVHEYEGYLREERDKVHTEVVRLLHEGGVA